MLARACTGRRAILKPIIQFAVGQAVKELQILLNKIQSALGRISEDGAFGQKTRLRIIELQRSRGLTRRRHCGTGNVARNPMDFQQPA